MSQKQPRCGRQISIRGMAYAPTVELGVVFLFGRLAPQLGFCVENVHPHFPDCWAKWKGQLVRVEFEFRASNYAVHPAKGADVIVCWENDWETRPRQFRHLEIISLKPYVGAQRRVFVVGCVEAMSGDELRNKHVSWNVPRSAEIGDLVLIYRTRPTSAIRDLWEIVDPPKRYKKGNREGYKPGIQAGLRKLVSLQRPLTYDRLAKHSRTKRLASVRKRFQGKMEITDDWPVFYDLIVALNPRAKSALRPFVDA